MVVLGYRVWECGLDLWAVGCRSTVTVEKDLSDGCLDSGLIGESLETS